MRQRAERGRGASLSRASSAAGAVTPLSYDKPTEAEIAARRAARSAARHPAASCLDDRF